MLSCSLPPPCARPLRSLRPLRMVPPRSTALAALAAVAAWLALAAALLALPALPAAAAPGPAAAAASAPPRAASVITTGSWVHALSPYLPPKYPAGFSHFDYVNPDAPKGGVLRLRNPDRRRSSRAISPACRRPACLLAPGLPQRQAGRPGPVWRRPAGTTALPPGQAMPPRPPARQAPLSVAATCARGATSARGVHTVAAGSRTAWAARCRKRGLSAGSAGCR